jgi:hypothetical protein
MEYVGRLRRFASRIARGARPGGVGLAPAAAPAGGAVVDFVCNVCGKQNHDVPLVHVQNREFQSCGHCRSSLRMRSVMYALSMELYGHPVALPEFPQDKTVSGMGMSDWEGYANALASKHSYTNTFYHTEPRLDITDIPDELTATQRFLISSDVFEHIPVFALDRAFGNSRQLLRDNGFFVFTVPFVKEGETQEHFPRLHDFRLIETGAKRFLYNRTADGQEEIFGDLVFHGGDGMTLEMRMFSEPDLRRRLTAAGFSSVRVYADQVPEFGILWPMDWAVPIVARVSGSGGA